MRPTLPQLEQLVGDVLTHRRDRHQTFPVERVKVERVTGDRTGRLLVSAHPVWIAIGDGNQIGELLQRLGRSIIRTHGIRNLEPPRICHGRRLAIGLGRI